MSAFHDQSAQGPSASGGGARFMTLDDIAESQTLHTNMRSTYSAKWEPWEAFRELVQNWRDGIIKSFNLDETKFRVEREEKFDGSTINILYKASSASDFWPLPECLGYIRFVAEGATAAGVVEIVNRRATIQPFHFDLGGTTKSDDKTLAGEHGDGLKVALLVLLRKPQGYAISCISGGFIWTFKFDNHDKLVVELQRMSSRQIESNLRKANANCDKDLVPFAPMPYEDVAFGIGSSDSDDIRPSLFRVSRVAFDGWTKVARFLHGPQSCGQITVSEGDLITDSAFRGNIYLKGLLLKTSKKGDLRDEDSASITGKPLKFGYNFANGAMNRDRQSLATAGEEGVAIRSIWNQVLFLKPDIAKELHDMLNSKFPLYADVAWSTQHSLPLIIKNILGRYLFTAPHDRRWYYTASEESQNRRLLKMIQGLGREGFLLENTYWRLLSDNGLVRTAAEEQQRRFLQAGGIDPVAMYLINENKVRVHVGWLTAESAANELGFPVDFPTTDLIWNTAKCLIRDIIEQVPDINFGPDARFPYTAGRSQKQVKNIEKNLVEQRIMDHTCLKKHLRLSICEAQLVVSWVCDAAWNHAEDICVQVHGQSHRGDFKDTLISGDAYGRGRLCQTTGTCQTLLVRYGQQSCAFAGLKEGQEYFAMIFHPSRRNSFAVFSDTTFKIPHSAPTPAPPSSPAKKRNVFVLGDELETLDVMQPRKWHDGENDEGVKAVIGIPTDKPTATLSRKRQRTSK
ncbi:uncharacterized protein JN550_013135 [Neoarthrinium moseri]|uniref:uncharacterized protein n=1 Tax=Neoarthrinium moseri TaxID=1658444 RepID=UPI001FDDA580|nr:uncharacterized protein JN550_013135 [Neoarthrinium moseri]KAI1857623.1 hypothetical protein JN550_013135 [Neoarthrinium moseri]